MSQVVYEPSTGPSQSPARLVKRDTISQLDLFDASSRMPTRTHQRAPNPRRQQRPPVLGARTSVHHHALSNLRTDQLRACIRGCAEPSWPCRPTAHSPNPIPRLDRVHDNNNFLSHRPSEAVAECTIEPATECCQQPRSNPVVLRLLLRRRRQCGRRKSPISIFGGPGPAGALPRVTEPRLGKIQPGCDSSQVEAG